MASFFERFFPAFFFLPLPFLSEGLLSPSLPEPLSSFCSGFAASLPSLYSPSFASPPSLFFEE